MKYILFYCLYHIMQYNLDKSEGAIISTRDVENKFNLGVDIRIVTSMFHCMYDGRGNGGGLESVGLYNEEVWGL